MPPLTSQDIANQLNATLVGSGELVVEGLESLPKAKAHHLAFLRDAGQMALLAESKAAVALVPEAVVAQALNGFQQPEAEPRQTQNNSGQSTQVAGPSSLGPSGLRATLLEAIHDQKRALIGVADPDLAMVKVAQWFAQPMPNCVSDQEPVQETVHGRLQKQGTQAVSAESARVHASAVVDSQAKIGANVQIGPGCVIGPGVVIGDGSVLYARVTVMDESQVGPGCVFWPGVVIRERCRIGAECQIHPNAVIGADGFGYRPNPSDPANPIVKVPQIGDVIIGNRVEIGAGTCIDRGTFGSTVIEDLCKLDNLVQIGHNVHIKAATIICGTVAIGGSSVIGSGCVIGGGCALGDHSVVGNGVKMAGRSSPIGPVADGQIVGGFPAIPIADYRRQMAALKRLPDLVRWWRSQVKKTED